MENTAAKVIQPVFQPINAAAKTSGLSPWYLRQLLKNGTLPHIRTGNKVLVNVPRLLADLDEQSSRNLVTL